MAEQDFHELPKEEQDSIMERVKKELAENEAHKKKSRQIADKSFLLWAKKNISPLYTTRRRLDKILCFFNIHDWKNISSEETPSAEGERVYFERLHRCSRCGKLELKGMGMA